MNRTLIVAIVLNWIALAASAVLVFHAGQAMPPAAALAALFEFACLMMAIATLTAMGALAAIDEREPTPKLDQELVSQRMAKVMARQTAWLADTSRFDVREAA